MEAGLVFSFHGDPLYWHTPEDRTSGSLPDSRALWDFLWLHRAIVGGVAHTHPWSGSAAPSNTDVTTFAAIEAGLGERFVWPIVTFTEVKYYTWNGSGRHEYGEMERRRFRLDRNDIERLRELSR